MSPPSNCYAQAEITFLSSETAFKFTLNAYNRYHSLLSYLRYNRTVQNIKIVLNRSFKKLDTDLGPLLSSDAHVTNFKYSGEWTDMVCFTAQMISNSFLDYGYDWFWINCLHVATTRISYSVKSLSEFVSSSDEP